jgi:hypothetical protein
MTNEEAAAEYYEAEQIAQRHNDCNCGYCTHTDDPELDLETRLDLAETALLGIRTHLWKLDHRLNELIEWNNRFEQSKK